MQITISFRGFVRLLLKILKLLFLALILITAFLYGYCVYRAVTYDPLSHYLVITIVGISIPLFIAWEEGIVQSAIYSLFIDLPKYLWKENPSFTIGKTPEIIPKAYLHVSLDHLKEPPTNNTYNSKNT